MSALPVYLVTGFLGGGKTTLLRQLALSHPEKRMMFLVNELSETDVDAGRLSGQGAETHAVLGGSIFCECKAADFLKMLKESVMPAHRSQALDALIIETSGIADPSAIGTLMEKAGYGEDLQVRRIVTILSPASFRKLTGNLPVFDAQVRAADLIVLNKCDLSTPEEISHCREQLGQLNPEARLVETSFCRGLAFFEDQAPPPSLPRAGFSKCGDLQFVQEVLQPPPYPSRAELEDAARSMAKGAYRVKGCLKAADQLYEVDATPEGLSIEETEAGENGVVIIRAKGRPALIACDVFQEELGLIPGLPEEIVWLPMGLHDRPAELREQLQKEIDRLEENPDITKILLLYGICGGGVDGLHTRRCKLVLPRTHDCIALLLGSNEAHRKIREECPGTYFYAPGWIREKRVPGPDRKDWLRTQYADRYDEEMIEELIEVDEECFAPYEKALFIRTPAEGGLEASCRKCAEFMNWKFESREADPAWLRDFLKGAEDPERFKCLSPGESLRLSGTDELFK